jgi:uncharacterized membrane protein YeaQ/YmgE (transglycosylase-associated protein family)
MSLLVILMIGASCGWLAALLTHAFQPGALAAPGAMAANAAIGAAGAFVTGALAGHEALLGGLSAANLAAAALGALALLTLANLGRMAATRRADTRD